MYKNNKGITLIALVITIIVMLILVGVTISMTVNGGLFEYAGRAVSETNNALKAEGQIANGGIEVDGEYYNSIDEYINRNSSNGEIEITITGDFLEVYVRDTIELGIESNRGTISEEYEVEWTSSNETIATINNGVVLGKKVVEGEEKAEVTIKAELKKGESIVATATKTITVKPIVCTNCVYGYIPLEESTFICEHCNSEFDSNWVYQESPTIVLVKCLTCNEYFTSSADDLAGPHAGLGDSCECELIMGIEYEYLCPTESGDPETGEIGYTSYIQLKECSCDYGMIYE